MIPNCKQTENRLNKLENNNVYSEEEQVIGTWIDKDGNEKKLYRKNIYTTTPTVTTDGTDTWQQVVMNNIDFGYIVNIMTFTDSSTTKNTRNIFWQGGTSGTKRIRSNFLVNKSNNKGILEIVSNDSQWNNLSVIAIVEYTKTTD